MFERSASAGDVWALFKLGSVYFKGEQVEMDYDRAKKYFQLGKQGGDESCILALKEMNSREKDWRFRY